MSEQPPPLPPPLPPQQPQPVQALAYQSPMVRPPIERMAWVAFVLGLLGFVPFVSVAAIVCGVKGMKRTSLPGTRGYGFAVAGMVLGIVWVLVAIASIPVTIQARRSAQRAACAANLRTIGQTLMIYVNMNRGFLPPDLDTAAVATKMPPTVYVCPSSTDTPAPNLAALNAGGHLSYVYLGSLRKITTIRPPARTVLAYEATSHHAGGLNALFADGHVELLNPAQATKLLADVAVEKAPAVVK